jgi:S-disulfanyl-L-cysteine oxidoreductase SoxD
MRCSVSLLTTAIALSAWVTALAQGPTYQMGRAPTDAEIKAVVPAVSPDGRELPQGSGSPREGAALFAQKCALCHGPDGKGGVIRGVIPLGNAKPVKLPYSLVPYATTVWDFINRAMPQNNPGTLTPNEVYALTAYVLFRNDVIKETDVLDAKTLPAVRMPNRDNMIPAQPEWKAGAKRQFGNYP